MFKKLLIILLLCGGSSVAQKQNNFWYFGSQAGLDFNSGSPVAVSGGQVNTSEGVSCISDASGNLLFYSDGITVWNKLHTPMPNGSGLNGDWSSTQSALIVPQPGQSNIYFLFTTDDTFGTFGVCYSVVDMSLNGGLGDVTLKNIALQNPASEQLTACRQLNGTDYWILSHERTGNQYYVYPLTASGVGAPVISAVGGIFGGTSIGQMKYSCVNNKVANVFYTLSVDLLDFDPATGVLSNAININNFLGTPYGLEFSPNGNLLYITTWDQHTLTQFDITSGNAATIGASSVQIAISPSNLGTLQMGPDNKIYVARLGSPDVGLIDSPDQPGIACNYTDFGVNLNGNICQYGLPNFPQCVYPSSTVPTALFTAPNHICPGTCTNFTNMSINASSFLWTFAGATPLTSIDVNPQSICYNTPGTYPVSLIAWNSADTDTITLNNYITVYPYPAPQGISQSGDTLFANAGAVSYQWYHDGLPITGATNYFYVATESGNYNIVATDANGCEVEAVIFDVAASIQTPPGNSQLTVFPNPVGEMLTVKSYQLSGTVVEISIYNLLGEMVLTAPLQTAHCKLPTCSIDVSQLPPASYYLEATDGKMIYRTPFIKLN
jgi:PKD repeat protein